MYLLSASIHDNSATICFFVTCYNLPDKLHQHYYCFTNSALVNLKWNRKLYVLDNRTQH